MGYLVAFALMMAEPSLEIPGEVRPSGQYAIVLPKTDAVSVVYIGLDGVEPLPSALLKNETMFLLDCRGLAEGRYRFVAVAASANGKQVRADFVLIIEKSGNSPKPMPKGDVWVVVVHQDGPLSADLAKHLADPVWAKYQSKGVRLSRRPLSQLREDLASVVGGRKLPAIIILRDEGKESEVISVMELPSVVELDKILGSIVK